MFRVLWMYNFEYTSFMNTSQAYRSRRCNGTPLELGRSVNPILYYLEPTDFQILIQPCLHENRNVPSEHILLPPQYIVIYRRAAHVVYLRDHSSIT